MKRRGRARARGPCEIALSAALDTLTSTLIVAGHYFEKHEGHPLGCDRAGCRSEDLDVWRRCAADEVKATLAAEYDGQINRRIALMLVRPIGGVQ